jgi:hypothetical protein
LSAFIHPINRGTSADTELKYPLKLTPVMDEESNQLYVVDCPDIGLYAFAHTREELIDAVNEQILMMWDEYATISPDKLAKDAKIIQHNLLEIINEAMSSRPRRTGF